MQGQDVEELEALPGGIQGALPGARQCGSENPGMASEAVCGRILESPNFFLLCRGAAVWARSVWAPDVLLCRGAETVAGRLDVPIREVMGAKTSFLALLSWSSLKSAF